MNRTIDCQVISLGRVAYAEAWELQERLATARGKDEIPDTLLLLEHPHTYTLGTSSHIENVLFTPEQLAAKGIEIYNVNRGGDVTYHGPGQLVGYPLTKLPAGTDGIHADVVGYVRLLEQVLINALAGYGIVARRYPGYTGVWVDNPEAKIAAIGVKVTTRRVTMHGFALNVNTDLDYFKGIIPCGIADKPVTSMTTVLGQPLDFVQVAGHVATAFGEVFGKNMILADRSALG